MPLFNDPFNAWLFTCFCIDVFFFIIMRRNDFFVAHELERSADALGLHSFSGLIRIFAIAFSFNKSRQKAELAEFIGALKEIERRVQRYEYFAERYDTLKQESNALNERQRCLLAEATKELERLSLQVCELVQSLETYRQKRCDNPWLRRYLSTFRGRKKWNSNREREECELRLGCCAASCGCCEKPRGDRAGLGDNLGWLFMRIARTYLEGHAHCSIDCGCCIERRGFGVFTGEL